MVQPSCETVRLRTHVRDIPKGAIGVVRSVWFSPNEVYEVEFDTPGQDFPSRVLLTVNQIEQVETAHDLESVAL